MESQIPITIVRWPHGQFLLVRWHDILLDVFHIQEDIVQSVQRCLAGLFESHGWTHDSFTMVAPEGVHDHGNIWAELDDRFYGASVLIHRASMKEVFTSIGYIFDDLRSLASFCEPSIMVRIWPICHRIYAICQVVGNFQLMYQFLGFLMSLASGKLCLKHPLSILLDGLCKSDQVALINNMRLGYLKSIRSFERLVGSDHAIVLKMWSNYIKYWDSQDFDRGNLAGNFRRLLQTEATYGPTSEQTIRVAHSFTYAVYYTFNDQDLSRSLAEDLLGRTICLPAHDGEIIWSIETQSYAFASKVLALLAEDRHDRAGSEQYWRAAIQRLKTGDRECKTRAIMLSEELETCLIGWRTVYDVEGLHCERQQMISELGN
jgi:hypothetical protein